MECLIERLSKCSRGTSRVLLKKKEMEKYTENTKQITRKTALKKMGTYAAFTALGTMVLLSPKVSQAGSTTPEPPKKEKK